MSLRIKTILHVGLKLKMDIFSGTLCRGGQTIAVGVRDGKIRSKFIFSTFFPSPMISIFTVRVRVGARSKHMFRAHIKLKIFFKNFTSSSLEMDLKFYTFSRIRISTLCVDIRVP